MTSAQPIRAVIFDCDGVLVDSELLGNETLAQVLTEHGVPCTTQQSLRTFMGSSLGGIVEKATAMAGRDMRDACERVFMGRLEVAFRERLKAVAGMAALVSSINAPKAVASNSPTQRLELSLRTTGIWDSFAGHVYSRDLVPKGKPSPDLFLYAAQRLGIDPGECLVIEDGASGVKAAAAAGMRCLGFAGGGHCDAEHVEMLRGLGVEQVAMDANELERVLDGLIRRDY